SVQRAARAGGLCSGSPQIYLPGKGYAWAGAGPPTGPPPAGPSRCAILPHPNPAPSTQPPHPKGVNHMAIIQTQGVHHITFVGSNREATIEFYEEVLGMPLVFEQPNLDV